MSSALLTRQTAVVGSKGTTVLVLVVALAVLGVAMVAVTVWLVRATRTDHAALGPLEVMGHRSFRRAGDEARTSRLGAVRPSGAPSPAPLVSVDEPPSEDPGQPATVVSDDGAATAAPDSPPAALDAPSVDEPATADGAPSNDEPAAPPEAPVEEPSSGDEVASALAPPPVGSPDVVERSPVDEPTTVDGSTAVEAPAVEEQDDRLAGAELPPPAPDESPVTPPLGTPVTPAAPAASGGDRLR